MAKLLNNMALGLPAKTSFSRLSRYIPLFAVAAAITVFSAPRAAAQDPQDPKPLNDSPSDDAQQTQPQTDQRKVISRDTIPNAQNPQAQDNDRQDNDQGPRRRRAGPNRRQYQPTGPVPADFTIPAGKVIFARLNEPLSSDRNHPGDTFTATLDQPIVINGWVVARRGETVVGTVTEAKKAGRVKGVSQLGLALTDITIADGNQLPVSTELWKGSAGTSHGRDAAGIATTTGAGAIIGAAADGGTGAGIGAGAGAVAGIAAVLLTRGRPTVLGPEARVSFRLTEPLSISTESSAQSFQPVGSDDYNTSPSRRSRGYARPGGYPVGYPYPYYAGCNPYWGCGPYYPYPYYGYYGPSVGFYWGGGFGHRFGRGFRR